MKTVLPTSGKATETLREIRERRAGWKITRRLEFPSRTGGAAVGRRGQDLGVTMHERS